MDVNLRLMQTIVNELNETHMPGIYSVMGAMQDANRILDTYGVETIRNGDDDIAIVYCNVGDPFRATVLWTRDDGLFSVGCWGDIVEQWATCADCGSYLDRDEFCPNGCGYESSYQPADDEDEDNDPRQGYYFRNSPTMRQYTSDALLGVGCDRAAFVYDDASVVKVSLHRSGANANEREYRTWATLQGTDKARSFAAILEYIPDETESWLMVERVTVTMIDWLKREHRNLYNRYCYANGLEIARIPGLEDAAQCVRDGVELGLHDLHMANIGRRTDGSWCIIDYAQ